MADYRQLHTRIWADSWFSSLPPEQKLLFIYCFGNSHASVCGLYELPVRIISFETGLERTVIERAFGVFNKADKISYDAEAGVIWVKNMLKYQGSTSPKLQARIEADIKAVPDCGLKKQFLDTVSIRYGRGSDTPLSVSNSDSGSDSGEGGSGGEPRQTAPELEEDDFIRQCAALVGVYPTADDLPVIAAWERQGVIPDDIRDALQWRKDNEKAPVKIISNLAGGVETARLKRIQGQNAKPGKNGNGHKPDIAEQWAERARSHGNSANL